MTETFCPKWTRSIRGKRLRLGVIGPKPYFFVKDGEIKGSDMLMAGYLAKRLNFEYELVRPKGAFSGMVSAVCDSYITVRLKIPNTCYIYFLERFQEEIWIWVLHRLPICTGATNWLTISIPLPTTTSSWGVNNQICFDPNLNQPIIFF